MQEKNESVARTEDGSVRQEASVSKTLSKQYRLSGGKGGTKRLLTHTCGRTGNVDMVGRTLVAVIVNTGGCITAHAQAVVWRIYVVGRLTGHFLKTPAAGIIFAFGGSPFHIDFAAAAAGISVITAGFYTTSKICHKKPP